MIRSLLLATLLAGASLPALAEQFSLSWAPRDAREARLLSSLLTIHALRNQLREDGRIDQRGQANAALLLQRGGGNLGLIRQDGEGHEAALAQTGGRNAHAIIQGGKGARADVAQSGSEAGVTLQYGW